MTGFLDSVFRKMHKDPAYRSMYNNLCKARKFTLDEGMSAHLADLATMGIVDEPSVERKVQRLHEFRRLAVPPYDVSWFEYDQHAYLKRAQDVHKLGLDLSTDIVRYTGYVVKRSTRFPGVASVNMYMGDGNKEVFSMPFVCIYRNDEAAVPEDGSGIESNVLGQYVFLKEFNDLAVGVRGFMCDQLTLLCSIRHLSSMEKIMYESAGFVRHIWALLATINDVPTYRTEVKAPRGIQRRHNYQRFMDHSVITLKVPMGEAVRQLSERIDISRRRAHQVRGHWRLYHRGEAAMCDKNQHQWGPSVEAQVKCTKCPAWKTWIPDHQRGDAGLGWVTHDYKVEHATP